MSYSVYFKTTKQIVPEELFTSLCAKSSPLLIVSDEFPCLKCGVKEKSLRGIEINRENDEYEVRICACASREDYLLFINVIETLKEMYQVHIYTEGDEPIGIVSEFFSHKWVETQMYSSMSITCALVNHLSSAVVFYGLFLPYCIGPNCLNDFGIDLHNPDMQSFLKLIDYLVEIQWSLSEKESTWSRLAIQNPSDDSEKNHLSLIHIKDNKLADFDYIEHCPLFSICDHDSGEQVIIPFESLPYVAYNHPLVRIDEYQYYRAPEFSVQDAREMIEVAKRFQPDNLFQHPEYPGNGYNDEQQTFILKWNPSISSISIQDHVDGIQMIHTGYFNWSVYEWEKAKMGDRFYMIRVGEGNTGVVMSGVFTSLPYVSKDWNPNRNSRRIYYMDMKPNFIVNPEVQDIITTEQLQDAIPDFEWRKGHSGQLLNPNQARNLEALFDDYIQKMLDVDDKENVAITNISKHI